MNYRFLSASILVLLLVYGFLSESTAEIFDLVMLGGEMTVEEVEDLEKRVEQDPSDVTSRTKLLGYYFDNQFDIESAREAKQKNVLWLIRNAPESEVLATPYGKLDSFLDPTGYAEGKGAWIEHLKSDPKNLRVLEGSATFFTQRDRKLAIESLQRAEALEMDNPKWPEALGHLYSLGMITRSSKRRKDMAERALEQFEIAHKLSTGFGRDYLLGDLAKTAFAADRLEDAAKYAEKMTASTHRNWNYGNSIHHGNIILGRLALRKDDIDEAKERLIKAGKTPGSPQLDSFGPDMALAKELLEKGERRCSRVFRPVREILEIRCGRTG